MEGLSDLIINGVSAGIVIYGVIEALKQAGWLDAKYASVVAILIGIAVTAANQIQPVWTGVVVLGASIGIFASMVYAGFKKRANDNAGS